MMGLIFGHKNKNFDGFSIEYFAVGVVGAKVLIYEFDEFGTKFGLDGLAEWGVVIDAFSSSIFFLLLTGVSLYWRL